MRRCGATVAFVVAAAMLVPAMAFAQDVRRGEHVYRKCTLCHVANPNAKDLIAPPLHNIVGRRAGQIQGFEYSDIMKLAGREGLFWTADALYHFLDRPEEFMPGTYMAFSGLDEQERRDLIAYLERLTQEWKRSGPPVPSRTAPPPQRSSTAPRPQGLPRVP